MGLYLVAKNDATVYAAANSPFAGKHNGYGNVVETRHSATITSFYAYLGKINRRKGKHFTEDRS